MPLPSPSMVDLETNFQFGIDTLAWTMRKRNFYSGQEIAKKIDRIVRLEISVRSNSLRSLLNEGPDRKSPLHWHEKLIWQWSYFTFKGIHQLGYVSNWVELTFYGSSSFERSPFALQEPCKNTCNFSADGHCHNCLPEGRCCLRINSCFYIMLFQRNYFTW